MRGPGIDCLGRPVRAAGKFCAARVLIVWGDRCVLREIGALAEREEKR